MYSRTLAAYLEKKNTEFSASLSKRGGFITFSNSGRRGVKYFSIGIDSIIQCFKDMKDHLIDFQKGENYEEKYWRDLSKHLNDEVAKAMLTVQTKPLFSTFSKVAAWANPDLKSDFSDNHFKINYEILTNTITLLEVTADEFSPHNYATINDFEIDETSIRDFAKKVFCYFFDGNWDSLVSETVKNEAYINDQHFISHDLEIFKRILGEFSKAQKKETLTTSGTLRFFEEPIYISNEKFYYFTTQWNGQGDYNLSFANLKAFIENRFKEYTVDFKDGVYSLRKTYSNLDLISFEKSTNQLGLFYSKHLIPRYICSLLSKPFLILTGLSGSGKTKIAQVFAKWICESDTQYKLIPVGADWTNREPLLGYPNALQDDKYVLPESGALQLILEARDNPDLPFFLILDEMNLSHVERYFADFLSSMESKEDILLHSGDEDWDGVPSKLKIPKNLFIIGTVNIDETTYMFSPKVLDRANVIEFRVSESEMDDYLKTTGDVDLDLLDGKGADMAKSFVEIATNPTKEFANQEKLNKELLKFFNELKTVGAEFGYRSAAEIRRFAGISAQLAPEWGFDDIMDAAISQKLLPKLHGSRRKLEKVLYPLGDLCYPNLEKGCSELFINHDNITPELIMKAKYPISFEKITRMHKGLVDNGFTSFAEA